MKIDLIVSADDIKKEKVKNKTVVVIDMLRATSVMTTAIYNGCIGVIPVLSIDEAFRIVNKNRKDYILGGERKAVKIDGFDCANSPLEYKRDIVQNKVLVMTTSNGTRAVKGSEDAKDILIGALVNAKAVANKILKLNNDTVIVNAGTYGEFSMDDFICSGYIIESIMREKRNVELTDIAKTAQYIYKENEDITSFIQYANHYKRIKELKLDEDLKYCCRKDIIDIVPEYRDGIITAYMEDKEGKVV